MKVFSFITLLIYILAADLVVSELTLTAGPVTCSYKKKDLDEDYDSNSDINIKCSGTSCTVSGSGATASNGVVTISAAGTYIVAGSLNGQLRIEATENDYIHIILNSATISSSSGPAIYGIAADKVTITLVGDSKLSDTTNYTVVDEEPDACLFIDADLAINGSGSVSVTGNYSDAIRCKKDLRLISGKITVPKATQRGIKAKNSICIKDATIDVTSSNSGIKVTRDDDAEKGYIVIDGGSTSVSTENDGIHAETHLTINGGYVDVKKSGEGLEGQMIDIIGGEVHVLSKDDGINASKIKDSTQTSSNGGRGGWNMGGSSTGTDGSVYINIVGGKTYVTVQGNDVDGIDSNGVLYIGGNAEVYVSNQGGAIYGNMAAFDAEGTNAICSGATVIGTAGGSSKRGGIWKRQGPGGGGRFGMETGTVYQPNIQTSITAQTAGTQITVKDKSNNIIASFTPINAYSSILVTSPKMVAGQTYTIIAGTYSQTATASAGAQGSVTNPPSVTSPGVTITPSTTTKTQSPTTSNDSCSASILKQGYSCCSSRCTVTFTDEDGDWGVENGQWCGCGNRKPQPSNQCSSSILSQGYKCCSSKCTIVYVDEDGTWGIENDEWCGCNDNKSSSPTCSSSITNQGYSCCSSSNCNIIYTDKDGKWGVENNTWCGITSNCNV
jgi:hypothetical protein